MADEGAAQPKHHNDEAEMALIGATLHNNLAYHRAAEVGFEPHHFANSLHADIWVAAGELIDAKRRADPLTLRPYFENHAGINEVGGVGYLMRLAGSVASVMNAADYAKTITDSWRRRVMDDACTVAAGCFKSPDAKKTVEDVWLELEDTAHRTLVENSEHGGNTHVSVGVAAAIVRADLARKADGKVTGLPTGIPDLDRALTGLHAPRFYLLGGATSMGKTALGCSIAMGAARAGHAVIYFSPEMSKEELGQRFLAQETGISPDAQVAGFLSQSKFEDLMEAQQYVDKLPLTVNDRGSPTMAYIRAQARSLARHLHRKGKKLALVVVDYAQLIASMFRGENRNLELTEISHGLKALGKELEVPMLVLSQLKRGHESREDHRPILSDLRESGSLEQDADVVMFAYRHEYYLGREKPQPKRGQAEADRGEVIAWEEACAKMKGQAEVIIAKNRHGRLQTVNCTFAEEHVRWYSQDQRYAA